MRRGTQGKAVVRNDSGQLIGVNLGADFTAEHEWGIDSLRELFGIDDNEIGLQRRLITRLPERHITFDAVTIKSTDYSGKRRKTVKATWWGLVCFAYAALAKETPIITEDVLRRCELTPYGEDDFFGSWDGRSFGFIAKNENVVREIAEAFDRLDICLGLFGGKTVNPFSRSGLGILIASRVPAEVSTGWADADLDARRLKEAAAATGIVDRLRDAGCRYYALSPRWQDGDSQRGKHPVIFWLNPSDQQANDHGWFTVEELDQWIAGKGPIPKKRSAAGN